MRSSAVVHDAAARRAAQQLPLSRFERLYTLDVDQARITVAEAFCPHRLTAMDGEGPFETRFHAAGAGDVSLCYLDYGSRVHIAPEQQETFYLVLIPLSGGAELSHGHQQADYGSDAAAVPPVDRPYSIRVGGDSPHLVLRIERDRLEGQLRSMLALPVVVPVRFALRMDMAAAPLRSWRRVVNLLLDEIDGDGLIPVQPLAMRELERLLLGQLLLAQPNNYSVLLHEQPRAPAPRAIRHAAELIAAHAAEPLTVSDIAEAVGLSVRALQEGFRRFLDTTPTAFLCETRLRQVREELAAADPTAITVTETAVRWGFLHAGRFSVLYHKRFGETASATLRN